MSGGAILARPPRPEPLTVQFLRLALVTVLLALAPAVASAQATLANPASQNCVAKGGKVTFEKKPQGGEYGVCVFADNLQCEEWAMLREQCRTGGIEVTGYVTPAARYCAITGGTYEVTSGSNTPDEKGTCAFRGANTCDALAHYEGSCTRQVVAAARTIEAHFACAMGKSIDATFVDGPAGSVRLALSDGRKLTLPQAMSGSGARYANADESVVFWNKGNTAFVEEKGKTTYEGCTTRT
jgi:putative hemolysin